MWDDYVLEPYSILAKMMDDALEQNVRNNADTSARPVGTKFADYGVVDPD